MRSECLGVEGVEVKGEREDVLSFASLSEKKKRCGSAKISRDHGIRKKVCPGYIDRRTRSGHQ